MKRIMAFLMSAVAILGIMAGCGGGEQKKDPPPDGDQSGGQTIQTKYEGEIMSPDYDVVDETQYTVYYFDAENGNDSNDGKSESSPKKSISELNRMIARADADSPTKFMLKGGSVFKGSINLQYTEASEETPLIIDSYGEGRAVIDGNGEYQAVLVSVGNLRVRNLEITNPKGFVGIYVYLIHAGALKNLVISGCDIHDVNWNWTSEKTPEQIIEEGSLGNFDVQGVCPNDRYVYERGGIIFNTHADVDIGASWYENIWVEDNHVARVARSGMFFTSMWIRSPSTGWGVNRYVSDDNGWFPSKNVFIRDNFVEYTGGDNIVLLGSVDSFIERNTGYHSNFLGRSGYANAGIWPINVRNVVIQYNEAAYSHLENGAVDGEGFDLDIGCKDVLFQYNYAHDNAGGGLLVCNAASEIYILDENGNYTFDENGKPIKKYVDGDWTNVIVRNNLFVNNGQSSGNPAFLVASSSCKNMYVYNNIVIMRTDLMAQPLITSGNFASTAELPTGFVFKNNIFYSPVQSYGSIGLENMRDYTFENNVYYNLSEELLGLVQDKSAITQKDPQFTIPQNLDGYDKVNEFIPANEMMFTGGSQLERMLSKDLAGQDAEGIFYFGAFCKKSV